MKSDLNRSLFVLILIPCLTTCGEERNPANSEPDEPVQGFVHVDLVTMTDQLVKIDQTVLIDGTVCFILAAGWLIVSLTGMENQS